MGIKEKQGFNRKGSQSKTKETMECPNCEKETTHNRSVVIKSEAKSDTDDETSPFARSPYACLSCEECDQVNSETRL